MKDILPIDNTDWLKLKGISLVSIGVLLFTLDENASNLCVIIFSCFCLFAGIAGLYFIKVKGSFIKRNLLLLESLLSILTAFTTVYYYFYSANLLQDFLKVVAFFSGMLSILFFIYLFRIIRDGLKVTSGIFLLYAMYGIFYSIVPFIIVYHNQCDGNFCIINYIGTPILLQGILLLILLDKFYCIKQQTYMLLKIKNNSSNRSLTKFALIKIPKHYINFKCKLLNYLLN